MCLEGLRTVMGRMLAPAKFERTRRCTANQMFKVSEASVHSMPCVCHKSVFAEASQTWLLLHSVKQGVCSSAADK